jgi:hypothetical protein
MDLPYPGHLPTLGLLKRKGAKQMHEISELDGSQMPPPRHSNIHNKSSKRRGYDFY